MKIEREVKIIGANLRDLRRRLKRYGAKFNFRSIVREAAFKNAVLRRKNILLRVRKINRRSELTVKERKKSRLARMSREYEVAISDFNEAARILGVLGFRQARYREKIREEWLIGGAKVEIDRYPGFPAYVEIEAESVGKIFALARKLGLSRYELTTNTSTDLLRLWKARNPNRVIFRKRQKKIRRG